MKIINLSEQNSIIGQYMAEMRDVEYQKNRLLFRNNITRIGEFEAFEISKTLDYETVDVTTPLGVAQVNVPTDKIVLATIFRAGLPFHEGFLNIFDHAGNAFVSAYREYTAKRIHVCSVIATPEGIEHIKNAFPEDKTTIWCAAIDPGMNEHKYIVPGFGDAGDLCYGGKL